jgi:hypothetical protein
MGREIGSLHITPQGQHKGNEMTNEKNQIRGNCQCCGRLQAVRNGHMSKHGYTKQHGWFAGVCSGERYAPMQTTREQTDKVIADITAEIPELIAKADLIKAGNLTPKFIVVGRYDNKKEIPFADADKRQQANAVYSLEWSFRNRASAGKTFIATLDEIADEKHGTELLVITK